MIYVDKETGAIANGFDCSHWNGAIIPASTSYYVPYFDPWVQLIGMKACDIGQGKGMLPDGSDPQFKRTREIAKECNVRWRAFYIYLRPTSLVKQLALLANTVGELSPGECVYVDWEDAGVILAQLYDFIHLLDSVYPNRYLVYCNDNSYMEQQYLGGEKAPLWFPHYRAEEVDTPIGHGAVVWQTGKAKTPYFGTEVPLDYVLQPRTMDRLCYNAPQY